LQFVEKKKNCIISLYPGWPIKYRLKPKCILFQKYTSSTHLRSS